ncbi:MAG: CDP-glycerol glycerophosphotransferase family protein [Coriobacteriales bacterium]|jgi:CDP-ribitol ribitolphosphotransferase|nr:CDP-glycerol glycerophosphotransferase family protein [Coriobacteriales bacterium]
MGACYVYVIYRVVINALYVVLRLAPTRNRVALLSRQSNEPSLDFRLLETALRAKLPGWEFVTACYRDSGDTLERITGTYRQLKLVATSKLCIVDGYTPAVSIPRLDPSTVVVQLWHALGAFKRFGWQAVGTRGGRTLAQAQQLKMHRNYTLVIAGGEGARTAFAQAFDCPEDRIVPLGLPRMDYLIDSILSCERKELAADLAGHYPQLVDGRVNVLFAPTFRRKARQINAQNHVRELADALPAQSNNLIVAFHPFSTHRAEAIPHSDAITFIPHTKGIDLLEAADYVVTDYSTIALEAALLYKKVLFYVPDIASYRQAPGLNIDPEKEFPGITFKDAASLAAFIAKDISENCYAESGFWSYCDAYLTGSTVGGTTERLAAQLVRMVA